jgi:hypothetical protein
MPRGTTVAADHEVAIGKKRSQKTSSTTFWTPPITYVDGFVHLLSCRSQKCYSGLSDFHTERKEKLFEKTGIRGGVGGSNKIPVSTGIFFFPPFPYPNAVFVDCFQINAWVAHVLLVGE